VSYLNQYDSIPPADAAHRVALVNGWIATDTRGLYAELRERRPIFQTPAYTMVTRYRDVIDVLSRDDVFTVRLYAVQMDPSVGPTMLARDRQALNWRHKSIMRSVMPMEDMPAVRATAARIANEILDKAAPTGQLECVNDLGRAVPYRLCGEYFGFPGPDAATMYRWSKATQTSFFKNLQNNAQIRQAGIQAGQEMAAYLKGLIQQRRAELQAGTGADRHDVLTRLLQTSFAAGLGFSETELVSNVSALLVGSMETTSQAIVQALEQILLRPPVSAAAVEAAKAADPGAFDAIVWEALRFNPINPLVFRLTAAETVLGAGESYETRLPAGALVFACTASAMWDGGELENPDTFIPNRPSRHYLHFGYHAHECLGIHVGEVMIPETIRCALLRGAHLLAGDGGKIDFQGGAFPERFVIGLGS
jgi:cytochrome P450